MATLDTDALPILRRTLQAYLREGFPGYQVDADGDLVVRPGGTPVWVRPCDWDNGLTVVRIWTVTNLDVAVGEALARFLLVENGKLAFGRFELDEDQAAVLFVHSLLGDFLNRKELETAVAAVAATAGMYRDQIRARFGGRLFGYEPPAGSPVTAPAAPSRNLGATQSAFGLLALILAVPAAIYAARAAGSVWLGLFVALLVLQLVGRGVCDVITDPSKVRRALYFLLFPVLGTAIVWGAYDAWGAWWLAVLLGTLVGGALAAILAPVLFPRIHREEVEDSARRLASR